MPLANWPSSIKSPNVGTLAISSEANISEFRGDVFANMIRSRRYTAKAYIYTATITLRTQEQKDDLDSFFSNDCEDGVLPFNMVDWDSGTTMTFQWASPPQYQHMTNRDTFDHVWSVQVQLIRMPGFIT
jgi:hypothetical protein